MKLAIALIIGLVGAAVVGVLILGINKNLPEFAQKMNSEKVILKTEDGIELSADYYPAESRRGVLLLHMMPANRKSWSVFAQKLQGIGFRVLAIDLRGHGESSGGPDGYKKFSDAEHQASRLDVEAGVEFLKSKGAADLYLGGASIGANLALWYMAEHPEVKAGIILSPGLDYRGIKTASFMEKLAQEQAIFLAASEGDKYSAESVNALAEKALFKGRLVKKIFSGSEHGTAMFDTKPEFMDELATWLGNL